MKDYQEAKPHPLELQVPRRVHPETKKESNLWVDTQASG
jgi:hypothetical protein